MSVDKINNDLIGEALRWIIEGKHKYVTTGTILIFLPGYAEIASMMEWLGNKEPFDDYKKFVVIPLHSSVTTEEQSKIFRYLELIQQNPQASKN